MVLKQQGIERVSEGIAPHKKYRAGPQREKERKAAVSENKDGEVSRIGGIWSR